MPSARSVRNAAILGAAGLAGVYAFEAAQFHRSGAKGFDLEDPPSRRAPPTSPAHRAAAVAGDPGQPAQRGCRTRSGLLLMRAPVDRVAFTTLDEHGPSSHWRSGWSTPSPDRLAVQEPP